MVKSRFASAHDRRRMVKADEKAGWINCQFSWMAGMTWRLDVYWWQFKALIYNYTWSFPFKPAGRLESMKWNNPKVARVSNNVTKTKTQIYGETALFSSSFIHLNSPVENRAWFFYVSSKPSSWLLKTHTETKVPGRNIRPSTAIDFMRLPSRRANRATSKLLSAICWFIFASSRLILLSSYDCYTSLLVNVTTITWQQEIEGSPVVMLQWYHSMSGHILE